MITGAAKVAGVVGWPVKHSLSPLIHNAWIEALGLDAVYVPFAVPPERFEAFLEGFRGGALRGLNVTLPHKTRALELTDLRSEEAAEANAANLLTLEDGRLRGQNTDGYGLLSALGELLIRDGPVLVLGAGGAAGGAIAALLMAGVDVRIAARRLEAAQTLAVRGELWERASKRPKPFSFEQLDSAAHSVTAVINATSAGLNGLGELPSMGAAPPGAVFMDMVYSPLRTKFLRDAAARGHPTVDGLAMLIGQARPSFEAFFGVAPPPPEVVDVRALCLKALGETD